jgi:uncharacterized RDD family membrane protein YckC
LKVSSLRRFRDSAVAPLVLRPSEAHTLRHRSRSTVEYEEPDALLRDEPPFRSIAGIPGHPADRTVECSVTELTVRRCPQPRRLFATRGKATLTFVVTVSDIIGPGQPRRGPSSRRSVASFGSRVAAAILDLLVLVFIASLCISAGSFAVLVSSDFEKVDPTSTSIIIFWGCAGAIAPAFLLYLFIALAWKGQTIGAAVMEIRVIRADGRPLGILGSIARVLGLFVYALIVVGGIGVGFVFRSSTSIAAGAIGSALSA